MTPVPPLDPQRFARAFAAAMQAVQQGGPCAAIVAGVPICVTGQPFDLALLTMWRVYPARSAGEAYAIARRWMALLELLAAWPPDWPWPATPEPGCRY
ncbi:MAG: hypothetical protein KKB13_17890, partial [Chloroflexi bacterium]|nr:hypothetical protein [Chloroflexota bacterium]